MTKANDDLNKARPKSRTAPAGVTAAEAASLLGDTQRAGAKADPRPGAKDQALNSGRVQEHTNIVRGKRDV